MLQELDGSLSRGLVRGKQVEPVRLGKKPVERHHFKSRPAGGLAELFCMMLVDPAGVFVQGKRGNFHAVVATCGQIAAHAVERPFAVCLVAEREFHAWMFLVILGIGGVAKAMLRYEGRAGHGPGLQEETAPRVKSHGNYPISWFRQ